MQLVLNPPVLTNKASKSASIDVQRAKEEAYVRSVFILILEVTARANDDEALKTRPSPMLLVGKDQVRAAILNLTLFQP